MLGANLLVTLIVWKWNTLQKKGVPVCLSIQVHQSLKQSIFNVFFCMSRSMFFVVLCYEPFRCWQLKSCIEAAFIKKRWRQTCSLVTFLIICVLWYGYVYLISFLSFHIFLFNAFQREKAFWCSSVCTKT